MKKLISFDFSFKTFTGEEIINIDSEGNVVEGGIPAWWNLGMQLSSASTQDGHTAIKYFSLAQQLGAAKELELDNADLSLIKGFVEKSTIRADFKSQLLTAIETAKEA
jgi:hypothetical protein